MPSKALSILAVSRCLVFSPRETIMLSALKERKMSVMSAAHEEVRTIETPNETRRFLNREAGHPLESFLNTIFILFFLS
jgi:hypothetical protein